MTPGQRAFEAYLREVYAPNPLHSADQHWDRLPEDHKAGWEAAAAAVLPVAVYVVGHPDGTLEDAAYLNEENARRHADFNGHPWGTAVFTVVP